MENSYSAGIYSAAARLVMPLNIIPTVIVTTVFPILVQNLKDKSKTDQIVSLVFKVLLFIAFTLAVIISFKAGQIVEIVYGSDYKLSNIPVFLLYWSQVFIFFNFFALDLLTAHDKQFWNLIYAVIIVVTNILLNIILIPLFSFAGVGVAKVISAFLGFVFMIVILNKFKISLSVARVRLILNFLIITFLVYITSFLGLIPYLLISIMIVLSITKLTGYFTDEELIILLRLANLEKWGAKLIRK
jgi:O-antigen/teichoic acid export membrane protein